MKIKSVISRICVSVLVIVMIVCLPMVKLQSNDNLERIYSAFLGTKSRYQGIIEIWNIDTFEGGKVSKTNLINEIAKDFQKKNKGIYVMVRTLTEQECLNLVAGGTYPDLFSCSYGVASKLKDCVKAFQSVQCELLEEGAKSAGIVDDLQFGVAWCKNSYYLISTKDRLEKAGVENIDEIKLSDICMNSDYIVKGKKSDKQIYSLSIGNSKYLMPQVALKTYNKEGVKLVSENSFNNEQVSQTTYSAYCSFIAGNSSLLLGTQRDVFRMENRVKQGKASDVIYEQVTGFTDLIQFMLLSQNVQNEKMEYVEKFVVFLTSSESQKIIKSSGLLSVIKSDEMANNNSVMQNIVPQNFSDYATLNLFIDEDEIKKLQNFSV